MLRFTQTNHNTVMTRKLRHSTTILKPELSHKELVFAQKYVELGSAASAYRFLYPDCADSTSFQQGSKYLRKPHVRAKIREIQQQAVIEQDITIRKIARAFSQEAFADRTAVYADDGTIKPIAEWPDELRNLIVSVKCHKDTGKIIEVKFERSHDAKKILAQWRGMIGSDLAVISEPGVIELPPRDAIPEEE